MVWDGIYYKVRFRYLTSCKTRNCNLALFSYFYYYTHRLWSSGCRSRYQGFVGRMRFMRSPFCIIGKTEELISSFHLQLFSLTKTIPLNINAHSFLLRCYNRGCVNHCPEQPKCSPKGGDVRRFSISSTTILSNFTYGSNGQKRGYMEAPRFCRLCSSTGKKIKILSIE